MSRSKEPLTRHNILLTAGSYERLQALYGDDIKAAGAIRLLVNSHLEKVERTVGHLPRDILQEGIDL